MRLDFPDFAGRGNFTNTIPGLSRRRGNPGIISYTLCLILCLYHGCSLLTFTHTHTHTHTFNGPLSGNTWVSQCQHSKSNLDFTEARDSEWQWHQLGHMQVCTSLQTDNDASTSPVSVFTGRMPFLPPNQQRQSTSIKCYLTDATCVHNACSLTVNARDEVDVVQVERQVRCSCCNRLHVAHIVL